MSHKRMPGRKKHGGGHDEEHENHERWLITYADMLTLLMVLFIVLFAMSQVDQKKFAELAAGLKAGFGAKTAAFTGQPALLDGNGNDSSTIPMMPHVDPGLAGAAGGPTGSGSTDTTSAAAKAAIAASDRSRASQAATDAAREVDNFKKIEQEITDALKAHNLQNNVIFTIDERGLVVTVVTSSVVFAGDRADLLAPGRQIIDAVVPPLSALPNRIEVDGHTNQLPVPTINYPSAWELSTARASAVVRYLIGHGIPIDRLSAAGFAGTRPLLPPSDPRAPTMNRRVDIVVLSSLPANERALLPSVAN
jgi:chemotaxis protein MotB